MLEAALSRVFIWAHAPSVARAADYDVAVVGKQWLRLLDDMQLQDGAEIETPVAPADPVQTVVDDYLSMVGE